jgi:F-type H+-transporting ATPase subunit a
VAAVKPAAPPVSPDAPTLFHIGQYSISNSIICSWVVVVIICIIVQLSTRRMKEVPSGIQNGVEALVEGWEGLCNVILEPKVSRWVFPVAVTFFLFALVSNLFELVPGVGSIGYGAPAEPGTLFSSLPHAIQETSRPFLRPATADANLTVVMALIFLFMSFVWALRYNGPWGLIKHVFGVKVAANKWLYPLMFLMFVFVGLMESLSIVFVRPLALAVRLYGNLFAGETLLDMMMAIKPFILAVLMSQIFYFFELFVAVVQAFVFAMLTLAFVGTLCTHADEESGH